MKNNIAKLHDCYGCGVCCKVCPTHVIELQENDKGFYSPVIKDEGGCIECGLCLKICAFNHDKVANDCPHDVTGYASWSNDEQVRRDCSSGGVGFEMGRELLAQGYKPIVVKYDAASGRAVHYIAGSEEDLHASMGSKYIQSNPSEALAELDKSQKYMFVGTPCQVDSMRRYIRQLRLEDNFVLIDFFCHGVPSLLMWDKYLDYVKQRVPAPAVVSWRNKLTGWHDSWAISAGPDNEHPYEYSCRMSNGDLFYKFFLDNYCLNHCCYKACKYKKLCSAADIRIGDLWGSSYRDDDKGVSGMLVLTDKGNELVDALKHRCTVKTESVKVVTEEQMSRSPKMPRIYNRLIEELRSEKTLREIKDGLIRRYELTRIPQRAWRKIKFLLKKLHYGKDCFNDHISSA